jgi:hypothetical protein
MDSGQGVLRSVGLWAMFFGSTLMLGAKLIWKTAAPLKVRFFFWLVVHERCWTADRRFRHGLQESNICVICDQAPETLDHLLCGCCLARQVWHIWILKLHL